MPSDFIVLTAAFLSGLLGGVHCTAMCGGIATSLNAQAQQQPLRHAIVLNTGRIFSYTFAGLLAGLIGSTFIGLVRIANLPIILRSIMGLLLMFIALRMFFPKQFAFTQIGNSSLWRALSPLKTIIPKSGYANSFGKGVLWGWLPCGLSTSMLIAAWFEASPLHSSLMMLAFGLGTLPLMTSISYSGAHFAKLLSNNKIRVSAAALIFLAGLLTALAPWLMQSQGAQEILQALGCRSII
jgi:sulfite exporter TauE/SafE